MDTIVSFAYGLPLHDKIAEMIAYKDPNVAFMNEIVTTRRKEYGFRSYYNGNGDTFIASLSPAIFASDDENAEIYQSVEDACKEIKELLQNASKDEFFERCGEGYNGYFEENDGSISMGYKVKNSGTDTLNVMLCHIYYGK